MGARYSSEMQKSKGNESLLQLFCSKKRFIEYPYRLDVMNLHTNEKTENNLEFFWAENINDEWNFNGYKSIWHGLFI